MTLRPAFEKMEESERVLINSVEYQFDFNEEVLNVHQWSDRAIKYDFGEGEETYFHMSDFYGDGLVTILADASPLRNRYIGYSNHADFLEMLVGKSNRRRVVFSSGAGDSLFSLIWRYFKLAVISLAVVIVFWLWKSLPRFGPSQFQCLSASHVQVVRFAVNENQFLAISANELFAVTRPYSLLREHALCCFNNHGSSSW